MALPDSLQDSMLPSELEFIASEEIVSIRPVMKMDPIHFISGVYGPFMGGRAVEVPMWIAVNLKLKKKCNIVPPDWLNVDVLQEKLATETDSKSDQFVDFPSRFVEIAKILLDVAPDDLDQPGKIRMFLKDLGEARQSKIRNKLLQLNHISLTMPGVSMMEVNEMRPFFTRAMGTLIQFNVGSPDDMDIEPDNEARYL